MKPITKYQSDNGKVFDTEEKAAQEDLLYRLEEIFDTAGYNLRSDSREIAEIIVERLEFKIKPRA